MTLTLELPKELEQELTAEARVLGLPLSQYALSLLFSRQKGQINPQSGAELVAYWEEADLIGSWPDIPDSPVYARRLREQAETRYSCFG